MYARSMEALVAGRYWGVGGRPCEACGGSPAAVHCRTCQGGGAYLCAGCDAGHARAGHERVWVCEVCERAPAAVTCRADAAALCAACDADIHDANPLARRHERVPVQPIGAAAAPAAEALLLGAAAEENQDDDDDAAAKVVVDAGKMADFLFADVMDPFFGQDFAGGGGFPHADSVVPNNGSCGGGGGGGGAVDLDFGGGIAAAAVAAKPSYSSYTAASLGHSVSVLISSSTRDRLLVTVSNLRLDFGFGRAGLVVGGRPGPRRDVRPRRERDRRRHRARLRAVQGRLPALRCNSDPQCKTMCSALPAIILS